MVRTKLDLFAALAARVLVGGFFVISGTQNLLNIGVTADRLSISLGWLIVILGALLKLTLGTMIIVRYHTKLASSLLIIYLTISSFLFYSPLSWNEDNLYELIFFRNIAILGGLLFIWAHSHGLAELRGRERDELEKDTSQE